MRRFVVVVGLVLASAVASAEERRPRILLSNDDGIAAPGLLAAYEELAKIGEVTVAAPAENQSGVGHAITYREAIMMRTIDPLVKTGGPQAPWYRIEAKPATCVRVALAALLTEKPDLVVSGINRGDNAGLTIYVSGTLGAAREAAFDGIPSIAGSQVTWPEMASGPAGYRPGAAVLARVAAEVLKRGLHPGTFLSLNFPAKEIKGVRVVPHSLMSGLNQYDRRVNPEGETYFWNIWTEPADPDPMTDAGALREGYATVTALRIDANDRESLRTIEGWGLR
jgi:5'/3'-nucleotidase